MQKEPLDPFSRISWHVPVLTAPAVVNVLALRSTRKHQSGFRMRFFDCNDPGIIGSSIVADGARVKAMVSHK